MEQKKVTLRIDADILDEVRKEAEKMRRSLTAQINVLLKEALEMRARGDK